MRRRKNHVFGSAPVLYHKRAQFDLSHSHKTAFSAGELIPFFLQEVYPGDSLKVKTTNVFRTTSAFLRPVMDNAFLDCFYFYIPNRLVFDDWEKLFGDDSPNGWTQPKDVVVPSVTRGQNGAASVFQGNLADYFGIPPEYQAEIGEEGNPLLAPVSVLPFRCYAKVYNDWFRDENLVDPVLLHTGDIHATERFNALPFSSTNYLGKPAKISKVHDYFTQLLPAPQKGSPVDIGSATLPAMSVPVITTDDYDQLQGRELPPLAWAYQNWGDPEVQGLFNQTDKQYNIGVVPFANSADYTPIPGESGFYVTESDEFPAANSIPANLSVDLPRQDLGAVNVNELRFAFQLQKLLERDARTGGRYREYLMSAFNVASADSRLQVSEYLGGGRVPLNIYQVNQTSAQADNGTPLGSVGAFSLSGGQSRFTKSFTEHGFVLGLCAVRQYHTYQQGIERFWNRRVRTDFYDPIWQSIGEQPVYKSEIYATANKEDVFGYNPAWEDLRYRPNRISGQMRSSAVDSYDIWHFADYYESAPVLGKQFIEETPKNIDRSLAVPSSETPQFIFDFYIKEIAVRCMPTYSVPSLIDHH